jgi:hypothetical protein
MGNLQDIIHQITMEPFETTLRIAEPHELYGCEDCDAVSF